MSGAEFWSFFWSQAFVNIVLAIGMMQLRAKVGKDK